MVEGQSTDQVAAPRGVPEISSDIRIAAANGDADRVKQLEAELRAAADNATHLGGGRRGN